MFRFNILPALVCALIGSRSANAVCSNSSKFDDQSGELCPVPVNYGHPTLQTQDGDLLLKLQKGKRFGIDYNRAAKSDGTYDMKKVTWFPDAYQKPIEEALQQIQAATTASDGKIAALKADTETELEDLSERVFTQLTPKLNALAAQAQLDSRASQCHGTPICDSEGECVAPKKSDGTACDDYDADTTSDVCTAGKCSGTNLCAGVECDEAAVCREDSLCFRGACLQGVPSATGTECKYKNDDDTVVASQCKADGTCATPTPTVSKIHPAIIRLPSVVRVTVTGSGFQLGSQLEFEGVGAATTWGNSETLYATHPVDGVGEPGKKSLAVVVPSLGKTTFDKAYTVEELVPVWGKTPFGDARDGDLNCDTMNAKYHQKSQAWRVSKAIKQSGTVVELGAEPGSKLKKGDRVLIIMTQDLSNVANAKKSAGLHEFHTVVKIDGKKVTIADPGIDNAFGDADSWDKYRVFMQRVPQYGSVDIGGNCELRSRQTYDGLTATAEANTGIVTFVATKVVKISGGINQRSRGHRGGKVPNAERHSSYKIKTAGWGPQDAFTASVAVHSGADGKHRVEGGDGGTGCPLPEFPATGGAKGGCTHDYGCDKYTGGKGKHGGGGGAKDYSGAGSGGGAALCPGMAHGFPQDNEKAGKTINRIQFKRFILGGGASSGGGGGAAVAGSNRVGRADGMGGYRENPGHGGGDGGNGHSGGGSIYIFAKLGFDGTGELNTNGGNGGGGGGGENGDHKSSGGGGGAGGHGGSGGMVVLVTGPGKISSANAVPVNTDGGIGGGGGGGGGVPSQHNPTASGGGGAGAKGESGAWGGGGGGGSPNAGGPYRGGSGAGWDHDSSKYIRGTDGAGGNGRGRFPGGGGGCSNSGGYGGVSGQGGRSSSSSSCSGQNWGKSSNQQSAGAGGYGSQSCGRDQNFGAGGGGGGPGNAGVAGAVFVAEA